jgi:polyisoprenoid-binding protein YceI
MSRGVKIGLVVVVVAAVAAVGVWYVALRDTAPPPADLAALDAAAQSRGTDGGAGAGGAEPAGADGTWLVADDDAVFAGYRIEEIFAGETIKKTAVGRTSDVTGTLTVDGRRIESVDVEVDTTTLRSDSERRDQFIGNRGLQTDVFPQATFTLTEPLDLPGAPGRSRR